MTSIALLFTCHNRKEITKRFLDSFFKSIIPNEIDIEIYALDDGSADGTHELLKNFNISVFSSDGSKYWAGGMRTLLSKINVASYDFILCVNDDIVLANNPFGTLLGYINRHFSKENPSIYVASCYNEFGITYGSINLEKKYYGFRLLLSKSKDTNVNTFNMNFCLIPSDLILKFGFLDKIFTHHWADFDYGLRLSSLGVDIIQIHNKICICERDFLASSSFDYARSFRSRLSSLLSVKEQRPIERFVFYKRHGGFLYVIGFIAPYVLFIMPFIRIKLKERGFR